MDRLYDYLKTTHYLTFVMDFTTITGLIVSLKKRKTFPHLKYFPIYFLISLAQSIVFYISIVKWTNESFYANNVVINIFICFEFLVLTNFFFNLRLSRSVQKLILLARAIFYITCIGIWILWKNVIWAPYEIFILEAILIIPLALSYFYFLFKNPPIKELTQDFAFLDINWSAVLFYYNTSDVSDLYKT